MPLRPTTFYLFKVHSIIRYNITTTTFMFIFPYILFFLIVNFTIFTVFFKKLFTSLLTTTIIRGVCQNLFFIDRTPPLPHRTVHIAPFLKYNYSYYAAKPKKPRCPSIGTINRTLNPKDLIEDITIEFKYKKNTRKKYK